MQRSLLAPEHEAFRQTVRDFIDQEIAPYHAQWEAEGCVDRSVWQAAGQRGLLGMDVPKKHGGGGLTDYRYHVVVAEELARSGAHGPSFSLHSEIIGPYLRDLSTKEQRSRWLPGFCLGTLLTCIAITEPEAGSDLQAIRTRAVRDGQDYVLNGQKTFITNGVLADLILVVARTGEGPRGASLLVVEGDTPGLSRRPLAKKAGRHAQDTAELTFTDVRVPATNLLGGEGRAFAHLLRNLPIERLSIAVAATAAAEQALDETLHFLSKPSKHEVESAQERANGWTPHDSQGMRFQLAELTTAVAAARAFTDQCVLAHMAGTLESTDAAMVKWWATETCQRVSEQCLQLRAVRGGFNGLASAAQVWLDARAQTIYGGTTEVMKELIGQALI
ncbi:acyl-CoA dehydrogenase family protein [Streptomyces noursei]|uniref:acyl-CoA dehydrogenase family protein n=1 Tax=Streptomyces noursei TaxID=1971 RepID=UPI00167A73C8|nr:acyl-CoA dehydrogenase family protein [Streptomyces noursei]MCZ1014864.1 acyl-CoA dehydrogenase family protein [Streptomyces noursei]GGX53264.1 acyl-CoA dehydrogenase [Streptomyces noursei]